MEIAKRTKSYEIDRNIFLLHYNTLSDYALLAIFIDENGKKTVSIEQVEALKEFMNVQLSQNEDLIRYQDYNYYYIENKDMLDFKGDNKYLPDSFTLKKEVTTIDLAQRIIKKFDKRQLDIVLPPELINLLLSLMPVENNNQVYQKVI